MKLERFWLSPEAEGAGAIGGGDPGGSAEASETPSDAGGDEGGRPALQVVKPEKAEASWRDALPDELKDREDVTPDTLKQIASQAIKIAEANRRRAIEKQIHETEQNRSAGAKEAVRQLVAEHKERLKEVANKLGDAINTDRGQEIYHEESLASIIEIAAKISHANSQQTAQEIRQAETQKLHAKKAFFTNPSNQDVLRDPELAAYVEHEVEVNNRQGLEVLAEVRRLMPILRKGRQTQEDDYDPLTEEDLTLGVGVGAAHKLRRLSNGYGQTEVNRGGSPRPSRNEQKRYDDAVEKLMRANFKSQPGPGY